MTLPDNIRYIDFHTHRPGEERDTLKIISLKAPDEIPAVSSGQVRYSAGIHPWDLDEGNIEMLKSAVERMIRSSDIIFAGEAGYDKRRGPAMEMQHEAFIFQAGLADETHKNMVIHCVQAWDRLLEAHRAISPSVRWIIHGFRGNAMLAASLVKKGFLFSLGMNGMREDIINTIPPGSLFLETDDTGMTVRDLYSRYAALAGITEEETQRLILDNFRLLTKG